MNLDEEWAKFLSPGTTSSLKRAEKTASSEEIVKPSSQLQENPGFEEIPKCEELYISTKTKVLFLNKGIDIYNIFWKIPIISYWQPKEGVVKKQIKMVSNSVEEYEEYNNQLKNLDYLRLSLDL